MKIAVSGANGQLGVRLIEQLLVVSTEVDALVRSETAKQKMLNRFPELTVSVVDYGGGDALNRALEGVDAIVHLVGIIKESRQNSFIQAHEQSCLAMVSAAKLHQIAHIVYLSISGATLQHANLCLASKARAEEILVTSGIKITVLQIPMVLGEGGFASRALRRQASASYALTFRAGSLEQPIYAGDVVRAIIASLRLSVLGTWQLAGRVSLTRRELLQQAARELGHKVKVVSIPISLGYCFAWVLQKLPNPPLTCSMLGVLDNDDDIDVNEACASLGIQLTSLDETLKRVLH